MSKSPVAIARTALAIAQQALPAYSSKFSPQRFTQPQLVACLVLMQFFKTDYRGICVLLSDWNELRHVLGLKKVPHYSTLCYAQHRLLQQPTFQALLHAIWQSLEPPSAGRTGIVDATGVEVRYASRYYVWRTGFRRFPRRRWPKLTLVGDAATHLIAGLVVSWGPSQDSPQFPAAVRQAAQHVNWQRILGDAAYDAEHNHRLCRDELGIRSTVIPLNRRRRRKWPKTRYRRQMKKRFFHRIYRQRAQMESLISRHKRRLGAALHARTWRTQKQECHWRVITHNLMILRSI